MDRRRASRAAWWIGGSAIALMAAGLIVMFVDRAAVLPTSASSWGWSYANALSIIANIVGISIGTVVAAKRPDNRIGCFFIAAGITLGISSLGNPYAIHAPARRPGLLAGGPLRRLDRRLDRFFPIFMLTFLFLLFPTGQVRSPRWGPVWWLLIVATCVGTFAGIYYATTTWSDPFPQSGTTRGRESVVLFLLGFLLPLAASLIVSLAAVIVRAIYSVGDERLQIKWFATGATLVVLSFLIGFTGGGPTSPVWLSVFQSVAFIFLFSTIRSRCSSTACTRSTSSSTGPSCTARSQSSSR